MVTWCNEEPAIRVATPKRPKKITGTRFAGILGLNPWATPFNIWCEITRTYSTPFIENKYTRAGKIIEPIIIEYLNRVWFNGKVVSAEDVYGKDPFRKTRGDFFPDVPIFGGMWDALLKDDSDETEAVIEIKTTGRIDKWEHGAPDYQALQGGLYTYHVGVRRVIMVVAVLEEEDYEHPENFKPNSNNVIIDDFDLYERYPDFETSLDVVRKWWDKYVLTGLSPYYDKKEDSEILTALRTTMIDESANINELLAEAGSLRLEIAKVNQSIAGKAGRLKKLENEIRASLVDSLGKNDTKAVAETGTSIYYELSKDYRESIDKEALERDGLLEQYIKRSPSYTLRAKTRKEVN